MTIFHKISIPLVNVLKFKTQGKEMGCQELKNVRIIQEKSNQMENLEKNWNLRMIIKFGTFNSDS